MRTNCTDASVSGAVIDLPVLPGHAVSAGYAALAPADLRGQAGPAAGVPGCGAVRVTLPSSGLTARTASPAAGTSAPGGAR